MIFFNGNCLVFFLFFLFFLVFVGEERKLNIKNNRNFKIAWSIYGMRLCICCSPIIHSSSCISGDSNSYLGSRWPRMDRVCLECYQTFVGVCSYTFPLTLFIQLLVILLLRLCVTKKHKKCYGCQRCEEFIVMQLLLSVTLDL